MPDYKTSLLSKYGISILAKTDWETLEETDLDEI